MQKLIRDGMVAVLVSPGYGAGWYSWNQGHEQILFDPDIVALVEANQHEKIEDLVATKYPDEDIYCGSIYSLRVVWVPVGTKFRIDEYDGAELLITFENDDWMTA